MEFQRAEAAATRDPLVGRILEGRYHVLELIGRGGMGSVYLAEHVLIQRRVALKMLHPALSSCAETVRRFHREAVTAANIGNRHVASVTDMGQLEGGSYFIVLEYLRGSDLAGVIDSEGPLTVPRALSVAIQLCDALAAVHESGIVHRDLKPENVFLTNAEGHSDFVKVLDFGICKVREASAEARRLTETGIVLGTPAFMAPEQIEGRTEVDSQADIYGVGAVLYFALAGQPPFTGRSLPSLFMRVCHDPPPSLRALRPDVPVELEAIILRALQKKPMDRQPGARALGEELLAFLSCGMLELVSSTHVRALGDEPAEVRSAPPAPSTAQLRRAIRRPWPLRAALVSVTLGALAIGWALDRSPVAHDVRPGVTSVSAATGQLVRGTSQQAARQLQLPNVPEQPQPTAASAAPSPGAELDAVGSSELAAPLAPARRALKGASSVARSPGLARGNDRARAVPDADEQAPSPAVPQPSAADALVPVAVPKGFAEAIEPAEAPRAARTKPVANDMRRELLHVF